MHSISGSSSRQHQQRYVDVPEDVRISIGDFSSSAFLSQASYATPTRTTSSHSLESTSDFDNDSNGGPRSSSDTDHEDLVAGAVVHANPKCMAQKEPLTENLAVIGALCNSTTSAATSGLRTDCLAGSCSSARPKVSQLQDIPHSHTESLHGPDPKHSDRLSLSYALSTRPTHVLAHTRPQRRFLLDAQVNFEAPNPAHAVTPLVIDVKAQEREKARRIPYIDPSRFKNLPAIPVVEDEGQKVGKWGGIKRKVTNLLHRDRKNKGHVNFLYAPASAPLPHLANFTLAQTSSFPDDRAQAQNVPNSAPLKPSPSSLSISSCRTRPYPPTRSSSNTGALNPIPLDQQHINLGRKVKDTVSSNSCSTHNKRQMRRSRSFSGLGYADLLDLLDLFPDIPASENICPPVSRYAHLYANLPTCHPETVTEEEVQEKEDAEGLMEEIERSWNFASLEGSVDVPDGEAFRRRHSRKQDRYNRKVRGVQDRESGDVRGWNKF